MGEIMKVLFTGYAPVHFVCFKPLFDQLRVTPGVDIYLSGGVRTKTEMGTKYDQQALYGPFDVPSEMLLPVEQIQEMDFDLLFCANTKPIEPRSARHRIQIFHGMSFRNVAIRSDNVGYDSYFVLGPYMMRGFEQRGLLYYDDPRALKIGYMKTDPLLNGTLDREALLREFGFSGDRPVVLYAPTGEKHNSMQLMGEEVIAHLRGARQYDLLIKPHDHPHDGIDWFQRLAPLEDEHVRLVRTLDVIPCLYVADLLISDASSVSNEYALLDRPMVFLDVPRLIKAAMKKGSMVDATWGRKGGIVAPDATGAVYAVAYALASPRLQSPVRRAMVRDLFYNPGHATEAAMEWLRSTFGLAQPRTEQPVRATLAHI